MAGRLLGRGLTMSALDKLALLLPIAGLVMLLIAGMLNDRRRV